jgi:hypothetical protein
MLTGGLATGRGEESDHREHLQAFLNIGIVADVF